MTLYNDVEQNCSLCPWQRDLQTVKPYIFLDPPSSSQLTINTAIVYMHRFYMHHSFTKFHRNVSILLHNTAIDLQPSITCCIVTTVVTLVGVYIEMS